MVGRAVDFPLLDGPVRSSPFQGEAEGFLTILLIGQAQINIADDLPHHLRSLFSVLPQVLAIVVVAGHGQPPLLGRADSGQRHLGRVCAQGRRDPGEVKPRGALKNAVPREDLRGTIHQRRVRPVVDHLGGTLIRSGLKIIDPHSIAAANDEGSVDPHASQKGKAGIRNGVGGQYGDIGNFQPKACERDRHIGLASPKSGLKARRLQQALKARGLEPQHDLAEGNHPSGHAIPPRPPPGDKGFTRVGAFLAAQQAQGSLLLGLTRTKSRGAGRQQSSFAAWDSAQAGRVALATTHPGGFQAADSSLPGLVLVGIQSLSDLMP